MDYARATDAEMEAWNRGVKRQSLSPGGFCSYCSEACKPFVKELPKELRATACEYNGNHPDCGDHDMADWLQDALSLTHLTTGQKEELQRGPGFTVMD